MIEYKVNKSKIKASTAENMSKTNKTLGPQTKMNYSSVNSLKFCTERKTYCKIIKNKIIIIKGRIVWLQIYRWHSQMSLKKIICNL